ncbi:hypothetical protein K458DRAFT_431993 [Lentithecium fluviatile CBS 122367]|uniref:Uncharacterized protein n=1 Tax=Lentithecium fluviatile CBS 122367 TaxID=1168545 RepID=A0A6G1J0B4_9PLEO|nr:hypothetical protein K458DRAFT_431993 [Lentithecium fluviatile CBS 122367]
MAAPDPDVQSEHHGTNPVAPYVLFTFAIVICAWWVWVGLMLARLWHYKGELNGPWEKFDIQPEYIRERLARQKAEYELAGIPVPILDAHQWQSNVRAYDEEELEKLPPDARKMVLEEQRISRMPAFVADDCGDESLFPDIPDAVPAAEYNVLKYGERTQNKKDNRYRAMGLSKLGRREWLGHSVDKKEYLEHHKARETLLAKKQDECIQVTPDGEDASVELLGEVVSFLTKEKPQWFAMESTYAERTIHNKLTGERWGLQRPFPRHPLEICARLCMEDFNIVLRSPFTGKHTLVASATCAPSGWHLLRQIGRSATNLLEPPLSWENFSEILGYFNNNSDTPPLKRSTLFVQTHHNSRGLADLLFITERHHFFPGHLSTLGNALMIRKERQSFRQLPRSGAVIFTARTRIRRVNEFPRDELERTVQEINEWPTDIATLKGRDLWGAVLDNICANRPAFRDDMTVLGEEKSEAESWEYD